MGGRFFVKDLLIHDYGTYDYDEKDDEKTLHNFSHGDPAGSYYGYNTNEVELNRGINASACSVFREYIITASFRSQVDSESVA